MACEECKQLILDECASTWTLPTNLTPSTEYQLVLIDKFGKRYVLYITTDLGGSVVLDASDFPDGLFTQYSGAFKLMFLNGNCETDQVFTVCDVEYECLNLVFAETSTVSGEVPEPFATVTDGIDIIPLPEGGEHTCRAVRVINDVTTPTYDQTFTSADSPVLLPQITHTDTDGSPVTKDAQVPMICTPVVCPSVGVGVSDSAPRFNEVVVITAFPSVGFIPTYYGFYVASNNGLFLIAEQATPVFNWTVNEGGNIKILILASDGSSDVWGFKELVVAGGRDFWVTGLNFGPFWGLFVNPRMFEGNFPTTNDWGSSIPVPIDEWAAIEYENTSIMIWTNGTGNSVGFSDSVNLGGYAGFTGTVYSVTSMNMYENGVNMGSILNPSLFVGVVIKIEAVPQAGAGDYIFIVTSDGAVLYTTAVINYPDLYPYIINGNGNKPLTGVYTSRQS